MGRLNFPPSPPPFYVHVQSPSIFCLLFISLPIPLSISYCLCPHLLFSSLPLSFLLIPSLYLFPLPLSSSPPHPFRCSTFHQLSRRSFSSHLPALRRVCSYFIPLPAGHGSSVIKCMLARCCGSTEPKS